MYLPPEKKKAQFKPSSVHSLEYKVQWIFENFPEKHGTDWLTIKKPKPNKLHILFDGNEVSPAEVKLIIIEGKIWKFECYSLNLNDTPEFLSIDKFVNWLLDVHETFPL